MMLKIANSYIKRLYPPIDDRTKKDKFCNINFFEKYILRWMTKLMNQLQILDSLQLFSISWNFFSENSSQLRICS